MGRKRRAQPKKNQPKATPPESRPAPVSNPEQPVVTAGGAWSRIWRQLKAHPLVSSMVVVVTVFATVMGNIADYFGAKQGLESTFAPDPPKVSARPSLEVSPRSRPIEGIGAESHFDVHVTNVSESSVSDDVLQCEVRPPAEFALSPSEHREFVVGSSPSGANQVEVDLLSHNVFRLPNKTIVLQELGTIPAKQGVLFEAVVRTRPGGLWDFGCSTVAKSKVRGMLRKFGFVSRKGELPPGYRMGDWILLLKEPDGGPPDLLP